MNHSDVIPILNSLVETCEKEQETFRNAADSIHNSEFRRLFNIFSQQRSRFISELLAEVHRLGGEVRKGSRLPSQLTWTHRKAAPGDEISIMAECQSEEESAVNDYQEALAVDLPLDVQYVVKRQYVDIKDAYDRIRILQRAA